MNRNAFNYYFFEGEQLISPRSGEPKLSGWIVLLNSEPTGEEKELLNKIMAAVGAQPASYSQIIVSNNDWSYESANSATIISFGVNIQQADHFNYDIALLGNNKYIYSDTLSSLNESVELKQKLWKALKSL